MSIFNKNHSINNLKVKGNHNNIEQKIIVINTNDNTPKLTSNTPDLGGVAVVGRDDIIKTIHREFENNHILVLYGQGGIGKTICSKYYANEHKNDYKLIRYMQFSSDIKTTLVNGCRLEEIGFDNFKFEEQFSAVKHYLEGLSEKTLLMIDINEGEPTDLENLPENDNVKILFTTRKKELISATEIPIPNLDSADLEKIFINNSCEIKWNDKKYLKDIIENILQSNTMVIALAAKVKVKARLTVKELHDTLNSDRLATQIRENIKHENKPDRITEHILKLFSVAGLSPEEQEILRYMSLIDYGGIAISKFKEWAELEDYNGLDDLIKGGWINSSNKGDDEIIFMHPVISDAVFEQTKPNSENCKKLLGGIDKENIFYELYKKVYLTIICEFIIKRIGTEQSENIVNIHEILGNFYFALGFYDMALNNYKNSLSVIEKTYGKQSLNVILFYNYIGGVYYNKGEFNESLRILLEISNIYEKYNYKDKIILEIYCKIGGNYRCIGKYDEALKYYNKALNMQKIFFEKECPNTAQIYNCFGSFYKDNEEYDKAFEYYFKSLNIFQNALSEETSNIAWTYNSIGFVWNKKGNYDKALEYYQKSLDIKEKIFGEKHWYSIITYNNMGLCYYCRAEYDKALEYFSKCLGLNDIILGKDYPDKKEICESLFACYEKMNDEEKAEEYRQLAEEIEKKRQEDTEKECAMAGVN